MEPPGQRRRPPPTRPAWSRPRRNERRKGSCFSPGGTETDKALSNTLAADLAQPFACPREDRSTGDRIHVAHTPPSGLFPTFARHARRIENVADTVNRPESG